MKKISLVIGCLIALGSLKAQTWEDKWNVGIHGGLTQYSGELGQGFYAKDQAFYGFGGLSVSRYLTNRFDASFIITRGEVGYLASRDYSMSEDVKFNFNVSLGTANFLLRYNFTDRERRFVPFVFAGGSIIRQQGNLRSQITRLKSYEYAVPTAGVGLNYRINPIMAIQYQEMFLYTSSDDIDYRVGGINDMYLLHTLGLTFNIGKFQLFEASGPSKKLDKCPSMKTGVERKNGEGKAHLKPKKRSKKNHFVYK